MLQESQNTYQNLQTDSEASPSKHPLSLYANRSKRRDIVSNTYDTSILSVLKHLPKALNVLEKQNYQLVGAKCLYDIPLNSLSQNMRNCQTVKNTNTRLMAMEEHEQDHQRIKDKINRVFKRSINSGSDENFNKTLWDIYSSIIPYYVRFVNHNRKSFANVLMGINGVRVLDHKKRHHQTKTQLPKLLTPAFQNQTGGVKFDSHFESGNLLYVYKRESSISGNEKSDTIQTYDLILQNDINTKGHNQWFHFKMQNTIKNLKVKINIVNLIKKDSLFNYGLKILTFSENRFRKTGKGWMRQGDRINYQQTDIKRENKDTFHYCLSFQYTFRGQNDTVFMCPSFPYTYTQLTTYLGKLFSEQETTKCLSVKSLTETVGGNQVNVLTISTGRTQIDSKDLKIIWILARQHPAETTSSFMIEGIVDYLVETMSKARKVSQCTYNSYNWLDHYIFKIVPMVNIDGVIHGNTRGELTGVDPNRMWAKPYKRLTPAVNQIKKAILQTRAHVDMILDLHSHSQKTGCFFYGNTLIHNPKVSKIYPTFVCENDQRFVLKNCRFRGGYDTTLRKVLFNELGCPNIFTVQCSLYGYHKNCRTIEFTTQDLKQMGKKLVSTYLDLEKIKVVKKLEQIILQKPIISQLIDYESARSDSSLSDQEFSEIYRKPRNCRFPNKFILGKKNQTLNKNKSNNENENTAVNPIRLSQITSQRQKVRALSRPPQNDRKSRQKRFSEEQSVRHKLGNNKKSLHNKDQTSSFTRNHNDENNNVIQPTNILSQLNRNRTAKQKDRLSRHLLLRSVPKPLLMDEKIIKTFTDEDRNKNTKSLSQGVQVQITIDIEQHSKQKSTQSLNARKRKDRHLCIVGSSIEDQRCVFIVGKNQVGLQTLSLGLIQKEMNCLQFQENCNSGDSLPGIQLKESNSTKIPKLLSYICNNVLGQIKDNAVCPSEIKVASSNNNALGQTRPKSNLKNRRNRNIMFRN